MFEQIGEGHKIMTEGPKPVIDLDELERQIGRRTQLCWRAGGTDPWYKLVMQDDPERGRGRNIAKCFSEADAAYIVAACNAVPGLIAENRALRERVRELERQREYLAMTSAFGCHEYSRNSHSGDCWDCPFDGKRCSAINLEDWINAAERRAAKEAGR